ncbi:IspD/TarI family cytidylyltransferase [Lachnospiraceae bacterium C1.1]|nr:IspD/TarI family cytidylyltransferase [Lachnospiraceae bacterium C1.1]
MNVALVLSGGIGTRLASLVPKQYINVSGKMIIIYCLQKLCRHDGIDAIHVVAEKHWWEPILTELPDVSKFKGFSLPGENRQYSILNGLRDISRYAEKSDTVFIHDAVRPMVSNKLIDDTLNALVGHDGAVPVIPLKDTVYYSEDGHSLTGCLERAKILAGQAPEAFHLGKYLEANEALSRDEMLSISGSTEPALMAGMDIVSFPGDEKNFKITTNEDLERFKDILHSNEMFEVEV